MGRGAWIVGLGLGLFACGSEKTPRPMPPADPAAPVTAPARTPREPEADPPPETTWIRYDLDDTLRLNEIQLKGSHNSYHLRPEPAGDPQWAYDLPTIPDQLARFGVRAVELDLHVAGDGFGVYHLAGDDPRTTCPRLAGCLAALYAWSAAHPGHQPLIVFLEPRDEVDALKVIDHLEALEQVVAAAWPRERVYTPDDLVGGAADVQSALRARGWPTLGAVRGKVLFVLLAFGDLPYKYAHDGAGLWGRRMFVTATTTHWRHAGILAMDSPIEEQADIRRAVAHGFLVRTRADDLPARGRDFWGKRAAALNSGAQIVLTDYPDPAYLPGYDASLPAGTPSRCNPLTAPPACAPLQIENPELLAHPDGVEVVGGPDTAEIR